MRLRTLILAASMVVSVLFFGGSYLVLNKVFERTIQNEARQSAHSVAQLAFANMYELMSSGWTRQQLNSFLQSSREATRETPLSLAIYRGPVVAERFGEIEQPALDEILAKALTTGVETEVVDAHGVRVVFPLKAEKRCLGCHQNAQVGQVLGLMDVSQSIDARLSESRREFMLWSLLVLPFGLLVAWGVTGFVRSRIERPLESLKSSVEHINSLTDLRTMSTGFVPIGVREFDDTFASFDHLRERIRTVAVDKDILKFEIGLLEKFVITAEVVRDWREYVGRLLVEINQVVQAHLLFSIFKIDEELFDLEVFWYHRPTDTTRELLEHHIRSEIDLHPYFAGCAHVRVHHHVGIASAGEFCPDEEDIRLQVKSFFVDTPKIGGIVGIGVQTEAFEDSTLRLVMEGVLSTLMNVVGSVKAIYKYTRDLEYYATRDPLTDLLNQRVFWDLLEAEVARATRHDHEFVVLLIDLDNFKLINDGYGHTFGDKYLVAFVDAVRAVLRQGDLFVRYGGDEFVIVLPETDVKSAVDLAERVMSVGKAMSLVAPDGRTIHGALSIGLACFPLHAANVRDLFLFADNMMYKAKSEGRGRIAVPTQEDVVEVFQGITQQSVMVMKAIDEKLVVPFFQPVIDVRNHEVAAYEVLSRIELDGRIVGANEFIEIAERIGVIHRIDMLVMERALQEVSKHQYPGKIFLNLSPRALVLSDFAKTLMSIVDNSNIQHERIVFEITERDTIKNLGMLERLLRDLRFEGFGLAIDDFGSGFSSFHYLRHFPLDYLKIEGDFILHMLDNPKDRAFVQSMQSLAAELGIKTVAEFVETPEILTEIEALGIDFAQGYHFGRPARELLPTSIWVPPMAR